MKDFFTDSLTEIERLVPSKAWNVMKTVEIYVNNEYSYDGKPIFGAVTHWSKGCLQSNGNLAEKEGQIEFYNIGNELRQAIY